MRCKLKHNIETWRNWSDAGEWALKCAGSNPTVSKHCRVAKLVDASDFDSDDESRGGSSPSSVAKGFFSNSNLKRSRGQRFQIDCANK